MKRTAIALSLGLSIALAAGAAIAAPVSYKIDPTHTDVVASWSHFGFSNPMAHFGQVDGTITYDAAKPSASKVDVTIPLSGMASHVAKFDEHLRSKDFFEPATHPVITFKSTKVESKGKNKLKVTGDLTVKGITRPAVLDVTLNKTGMHPMAKRPAIGFDATTTIKRSAFGMGYAVPNVSDDVKVRITTEAVVAATGDAQR